MMMMTIAVPSRLDERNPRPCPEKERMKNFMKVKNMKKFILLDFVRCFIGLILECIIQISRRKT